MPWLTMNRRRAHKTSRLLVVLDAARADCEGRYCPTHYYGSAFGPSRTTSVSAPFRASLTRSHTPRLARAAGTASGSPPVIGTAAASGTAMEPANCAPAECWEPPSIDNSVPPTFKGNRRWVEHGHARRRCACRLCAFRRPPASMLLISGRRPRARGAMAPRGHRCRGLPPNRAARGKLDLGRAQDAHDRGNSRRELRGIGDGRLPWPLDQYRVGRVGTLD
jgi:hypothetical protein